MQYPNHIKPSDIDEREQTDQANSDALVRLCAEHNITLPTATAHLWRPTTRKRGCIPGVAEGLTILCTDGVVAWFQNDLGTLLYGHIQRFDGRVQALHGKATLRKQTTGAKRMKDPSQRMKQPRKALTDLDKANALIEELMAKLQGAQSSQPLAEGQMLLHL